MIDTLRDTCQKIFSFNQFSLEKNLKPYFIKIYGKNVWSFCHFLPLAQFAIKTDMENRTFLTILEKSPQENLASISSYHFGIRSSTKNWHVSPNVSPFYKYLPPFHV